VTASGKMKMNINAAPAFTLQAFHPKAKLNVVVIWQVFWLKHY